MRIILIFHEARSLFLKKAIKKGKSMKVDESLKPLYFTDKDLPMRMRNMKETYAQIETFGAPARFSEIEDTPRIQHAIISF